LGTPTPGKGGGGLRKEATGFWKRDLFPVRKGERGTWRKGETWERRVRPGEGAKQVVEREAL